MIRSPDVIDFVFAIRLLPDSTINEPSVKVRVPLTVISASSVTSELLLICRFATADGSPDPVTCAALPL